MEILLAIVGALAVLLLLPGDPPPQAIIILPQPPTRQGCNGLAILGALALLALLILAGSAPQSGW
jgi:hypothetical protein